jgi:hypothetical protein
MTQRRFCIVSLHHIAAQRQSIYFSPDPWDRAPAAGLKPTVAVPSSASRLAVERSFEIGGREVALPHQEQIKRHPGVPKATATWERMSEWSIL